VFDVVRKVMIVFCVSAAAFCFVYPSLILSSRPVAAQLPEVRRGQPLPSNIFVELAKVINPAVVNISTTTMPQARRGRMPDDPMLRMLEQFYGPLMAPQPRQGLGTGFIIRDDGLIITNNHVIEGADVIKVQLEEKSDREFDARVVGRDPRTDIALIKIDAKRKLAVAKMGDSDRLEVGEWVAAFGNPIGLGHSMTKGIVSGLARAIDEINRVPVIQTDASVNPGNSGGPLVNLQGEVVGVNNAIASAGGGGISFAIPINAVKELIPTLEKDGVIKRGFIGVFLDRVSPENRESLKLKVDKGALIVDVVEKGPAERGGVQPYDVVVKFGDKKIDRPEDLTNAVGDTPVGRSADVLVNRGGKEVKLKVTVQEHPDDRSLVRRPSPEQTRGATTTEFGFKIVDSSSRAARDLGIKGLSQPRPVVVEVTPGSAAARAGLLAGDVIFDVNRRNVNSANEVNQALVKGRSNIMRIRREDRPLFIQIVP
jgi:serine protease Do